MKTKYRHIHFVSDEDKSWACFDNKTQDGLGWVSYYLPWEKYVVDFINPDCVFDENCLNDIIDFLNQLNKGDLK